MQKDENPFLYSNTNKRYYTYDYYLKTTFGGKIAKLPLDGLFTCPNRDGTCGVGGCIYCSERGSGDFSLAGLSIKEQIEEQKLNYQKKWNPTGYIAYFQSYTNTYGPIEKLKTLFEEALAQKDIVGLNIATRADCLSDETVAYLAELSKRTVLTIELGLQSSNDETAKTINRGHTFLDFQNGFNKLRNASDNIRIGVHIIFGLPNESENEMLQTIKDVAKLHPNEVKIHLLHVLKNTALATLYEQGTYTPMERQDYIQTVVKALPLLPADIVVGRLTGDGKKEDLLAPLWSQKKTTIVNDIDKELYRLKTCQGAESEG